MKTVEIGNQVWTAENLKVTRYRNGDPIPNIVSEKDWTGLTTGAYCIYDNDEANADIYGYLYNWHAVNDLRGLAPGGWHVPSDEEWVELEMYVGITFGGCKLAGRSDLWHNGNLRADEVFGSSEFSALPGSYRHGYGCYGYFGHLGHYATFWSATETSTDKARGRNLDSAILNVIRGSYFKDNGFSVRLIKD